MDYAFIKFGFTAICTVFLGSHVVYSIYRPMDDFNVYVKEAELIRKQSKLINQK
jgi:hypothetical protein